MNRIALLVAAFLGATASAQTRLYVKPDAPAGGDGQTWATAMTELRTALDLAGQPGSPVQEVWVAAGTYRPDPGGSDRTKSFQLRSGLRVLGGFAGNELSRRDRNWALFPTILTGDLGSARSYHVVRASNVSADTVLDGFEITRGLADGTGIDAQGGGIRMDASSPQVSNCILRGNNATDGAGMFTTTGSPTLFNCLITGNIASGRCAAVYFDPEFNAAFPTIVNCTIVYNKATTRTTCAGITLSSIGGSLKLRNSIVYGNNWFLPSDHPDQTQ